MGRFKVHKTTLVSRLYMISSVLLPDVSNYIIYEITPKDFVFICFFYFSFLNTNTPKNHLLKLCFE